MSFLTKLNAIEPVPAGMTVADLDTPVPVVDLAVAERNLMRWQQHCDTLKLANRPHIKTHKATAWARVQLAMGAIGVTCQTLGEAEAMADAGIPDILISFNIVGKAKLQRLVTLARRVKLTTVADSEAVARGISDAAHAADISIDLLVECDTGQGRCGVKTPEAAAALAQTIANLPGLRFAGFLVYPPAGGRAAAAQFLSNSKELCEAQGLPVQTISLGGTPDLGTDTGLDVATEYRAGTYIYNDRSLIARGACSPQDAALTLHASVISAVRPGRAILDSGSKALTSDLLGLSGYGLINGVPSAQLTRIDEEHGYLDYNADEHTFLVGDHVRIVPNHACVVSNLFDRVAIVSGDELLGFLRVDARKRA